MEITQNTHPATYKRVGTGAVKHLGALILPRKSTVGWVQDQRLGGMWDGQDRFGGQKALNYASGLSRSIVSIEEPVLGHNNSSLRILLKVPWESLGKQERSCIVSPRSMVW
jgi:hypothetical protein